MILNATKGRPFTESFNFKNEQGKLVSVPRGTYCICLERGDFVKKYENLRTTMNSVVWNLTKEDTQEFEYNVMYFTLSYNGKELSRGVLKVN